VQSRNVVFICILQIGCQWGGPGWGIPMAAICHEALTFGRIRGNSASESVRMGTVVVRMGTVVVRLETVGDSWVRLGTVARRFEDS
jgi:hypothetical protein